MFKKFVQFCTTTNPALVLNAGETEQAFVIRAAAAGIIFAAWAQAQATAQYAKPNTGKRIESVEITDWSKIPVDAKFVTDVETRNMLFRVLSERETKAVGGGFTQYSYNILLGGENAVVSVLQPLVVGEFARGEFHVMKLGTYVSKNKLITVHSGNAYQLSMNAVVVRETANSLQTQKAAMELGLL